MMTVTLVSIACIMTLDIPLGLACETWKKTLVSASSNSRVSFFKLSCQLLHGCCAIWRGLAYILVIRLNNIFTIYGNDNLLSWELKSWRAINSTQIDRLFFFTSTRKKFFQLTGVYSIYAICDLQLITRSTTCGTFMFLSQ